MTTTTMTAHQAHEAVAEAGKSPDKDLRYVREIAVGQHIRQGDVYLLCVAKRPACYATETKNRQLAPGTSKGSRHILEWRTSVADAMALAIEGGPRAPEKPAIVIGAKVYTAPEADARSALAKLPGTTQSRLLLPGPCIDASERFTMTHPEHAHHSLPAGVYVTIYQLDPRSMRRVED